MKPLALASLQADRHYRKARDGDLSGVEHGVARLRHPEHGVIALGCLCGEWFWLHRKFRDEAVRRQDFDSDAAYRRAFRTQLGVVARDVSPRKARRVRGKSRARSAGPAWFK